MRKPLIAWAQLVSGLTLTALSFFQVITEIPYSTFAVLGGGFLTVDGYRNLRALRGPTNPDRPADRPASLADRQKRPTPAAP